MRIVFGLGNPGETYQYTRHNIGFLFLDYLSSVYKIPFRSGKGDYCFTTFHLDDEEVLLVKPLTYMNLSGRAVAQVLERFTVELENILVVVDDFQLPFGTLRFRKKGSDGGHNGLKSIIYYLNSENFPRLRMGIGNGFTDAVDFVLSPFTEEELKALQTLFPVARQGIVSWIKDGMERTMSRFNRNFLEKEINE